MYGQIVILPVDSAATLPLTMSLYVAVQVSISVSISSLSTSIVGSSTSNEMFSPAGTSPKNTLIGDKIFEVNFASKWMLVNGMSPSLEGYQSDGKRIEQMIGAVYNAVKESNIIYSNPPASFFGPQRIRLCETVFEEKFATCMDMTILFASCLESFGLHPVLITAPGHIFAGVWLNSKGRLQEPVLSDAKLIQKYIEDGQLVAVECTAMNVGKDISYTEAKKIANNTLKAIADNDIPDHECIDVQIARSMGIRPLPIRVPHANQSFVPKTEPSEAKAKEQTQQSN